MGKRIVLTGGHLTPALAVIEELPKDKWEVFFIGRKYALEGDLGLSVEYQIISKLGIPFLTITTGRLQRSLTRYTFFSLLKIPLGFFQSLYWLIKLKPDVVLTFGSYVAMPVAIAGWILKIPIVTHEQSVTMGLANKIIANFARKICLSWEKTMKGKDNNRYIFTGNPIRKEIFEFRHSGKSRRRRDKLRDSRIRFWTSQNDDDRGNLPLVYITGGSLGAHIINETVAKILPQLLEKYHVIHQCGDSQKFKDYEMLQSIISSLGNEMKRRYFLTKYIISEDIGWVYDNADLIISRAGANTITELAILGKPAILIPLPWAGQNEQMENAKILEKVGTAIIIPQEKLTPESLFHCTMTVVQNLDAYRKNSEKAKRLVNLHAAEKIVDVLNGFLKV